MQNQLIEEYIIDYIEIYAPMAKALAYWHTHALGFRLAAFMNADTKANGIASYVLVSDRIRLVVTAAYPTVQGTAYPEVASFISQHYCGVRRVALRVPSVRAVFDQSIANGAIPVRFPTVTEDADGQLEEASIKLYDHSEIVFVNRDSYHGEFKPGYQAATTQQAPVQPFFTAVDHIAGEVRVNEAPYWTHYLTGAVGTQLVQQILKSEENKTGMILNVNQSVDQQLTFVIAEPESYQRPSKVQQNIERFGPGIHHLAFTTPDLKSTVAALTDKGVEFVGFPPSYYDLLRQDEAFNEIDIDILQQLGILIDKEDDTYLLQKFIKPISDRPFLLYEVVQRVNGYAGFALKNINVLKKAEELEIYKA
jgi:4-hydroxyphenylpyruvate dioxygenase